MGCTRFEFRFRAWIIAALYLLGFFAPWDRFIRSGPATGILVIRGPREWSWLAMQLLRTGWNTSEQAFILVLAAAIVLAFAGAALRVWGTAYLGESVMLAPNMQSAEVVARGPYRYVRNPLYIGSWLTALAVSILMPPDGGLFFIVALTVFMLRLIAGEEAHLTQQSGEAYRAYRSKVRRLLPRIPSHLPRGTAKPRWPQSLLAEIYPIGVALSLAIFGWSYDAALLTRCLLVCVGAALVARALVPHKTASPA